MRNNYEDDNELELVPEGNQNHKPMTSGNTSPEEEKIEKIMSLYNKLEDKEKEVNAKADELVEKMQNIYNIQNALEEQVKSLNPNVHKISTEIEKFRNDVSSDFSKGYRLSEKNKSEFDKTLKGIADNLILQVKNEISEGIKNGVKDGLKEYKENLKQVIDQFTAEKKFLNNQIEELAGRYSELNDKFIVPTKLFGIITVISVFIILCGNIYFFKHVDVDFQYAMAAAIILFLIAVAVDILGGIGEGKNIRQQPVKLNLQQVSHWIFVIIVSVIWIAVGFFCDYHTEYLDVLAYLYPISIATNFLLSVGNYILLNVMRRR